MLFQMGITGFSYVFASAFLGTSLVGTSAISDVTDRGGFEKGDVISDVIYRADISMKSHRVQLY